MKKYTLEEDGRDYKGSYGLFPLFNAQKIESQEILVKDFNYYDTFLPDNTSFKNMTLGYIGEGGFPKKPHALADFHGWIIEKPHGIMYPISPKFKEILMGFNIPFTKFYNGSVMFNGIEKTYYVFQVLTNQNQLIDFDKSTFYYGNFYGVRKNDLTVSGKNIAEIENQLESSSWFFESAVMKPEFEEIDLCFLNRYRILISERLKNAIEEANLTGVKITPCPIEFHLSDEV